MFPMEAIKVGHELVSCLEKQFMSMRKQILELLALKLSHLCG